MYKIDEAQTREPYILLVPAMLDDHFPLLKYALYSREYHPVILEQETHIEDTGLKYVNNDMCYPCILNVGQMVEALKSGKSPLTHTRLLMPTVGDSCRGSNYISALRKAVAAAGFSQVQVVSMNLKGLEQDSRVKIHLYMVWRALFAMFYGDMLMLLVHQVRPYELHPGAAEQCRQTWFRQLSGDLKTGRHLTLHRLTHNLHQIAADFSRTPTTGTKRQRIGIVGDIYTKYCRLGNWDIIRFLEESGCETYVNGLSWYVLYYLDSHRPENSIAAWPYRLTGAAVLRLQRHMIQALRSHGFYCAPDLAAMKQEASGYVPLDVCVGDGWLLGAEAVSMIRHQCPKVLAIHPFGCLPGHVCGKGYYPALNRMLPEGQILTVDVDASGSRVSLYNRAKLLVDWKPRPIAGPSSLRQI